MAVIAVVPPPALLQTIAKTVKGKINVNIEISIIFSWVPSIKG